MGDQSKRLTGPAQLTNVAVTKYTVPALTRTTMRHLHVTNPSAGPVTFTMSIGADGAAVRLFDAYSIAAAGVLDWFPFMQLETAEIIQMMAGTTLILVATLDGTEHTAG